MTDKKLNGFNNGQYPSDGVGGRNQNELSEAGQNFMNEVQKVIGSKNIPQPTSDDLDKIATREWKLGYQYANWEWRDKIQKRINKTKNKFEKLVLESLLDQ